MIAYLDISDIICSYLWKQQSIEGQEPSDDIWCHHLRILSKLGTKCSFGNAEYLTARLDLMFINVNDQIMT